STCAPTLRHQPRGITHATLNHRRDLYRPCVPSITRSPRRKTLMKNSLGRHLAFTILAVSCAMLGGCTSYYQITDPTTGKVYHTTEYNTKHGAIMFEDKASRTTVNIQNAE